MHCRQASAAIKTYTKKISAENEFQDTFSNVSYSPNNNVANKQLFPLFTRVQGANLQRDYITL
jgi:hypothetical protein